MKIVEIIDQNRFGKTKILVEMTTAELATLTGTEQRDLRVKVGMTFNVGKAWEQTRVLRDFYCYLSKFTRKFGQVSRDIEDLVDSQATYKPHTSCETERSRNAQEKR